jgi:hypothetical protein
MLGLVDADQADHHADGGQVQEVRVPVADARQERHDDAS